MSKPAISNDLTIGDIRQNIKRLAIPSAVGFFCHTLYNMTDTFYVGLISTAAQSSLAFAFPLYFILLACCVGIGQSLTSHIANALGAKRYHRAAYFLGQGVIFTFVIGLFFLLLLLPLVDSLLTIMGAIGETKEWAAQYIRIIYWCNLSFLFAFLVSAALQAAGNTTAFRNTTIAAVIMNVALDPIFMFGWFGLPEMGVSGVALATVVSQSLGLLYLFFILSKNIIGKYFRRAFFRPNFFLLYRLLKQSFAPTMRMLGIGVFFFIVTSFLGYLDSDAVAAYGIAFRIEQIFFLPTIGLEVALLAFSGQNLGAGQVKQTEQGYRICLRYGFIFMGVGGIFMIIAGRFFISLFNEEEIVQIYGRNYLYFAAFLGLLYVVINSSTSVLMGALKIRIIIIMSILRLILLPLCFFYLFVFVLDWGVNGIWWGIVLSNLSLAWWSHQQCLLALKKLEEQNQ